jgi:hypothetical protein
MVSAKNIHGNILIISTQKYANKQITQLYANEKTTVVLCHYQTA